MRWKEYFNFRNHGNRELRTHGNGQEYTERDLGVCGYVFVPQRRQPRMDAGATEVWNSVTVVLRILKMCEEMQ